MTPPPIEQVRGAVAYLQQSLLDRLKDAGDDIDRLAELNDRATKILVAHGAESVAQHERETAREDRLERGMCENLCEGCGEEMPEDSDWLCTDDGDFCAECLATFPLPDSPDE